MPSLDRMTPEETREAAIEMLVMLRTIHQSAERIAQLAEVSPIAAAGCIRDLAEFAGNAARPYGVASEPVGATA